jgi:hypothetical protein
MTAEKKLILRNIQSYQKDVRSMERRRDFCIMD